MDWKQIWWWCWEGNPSGRQLTYKHLSYHIKMLLTIHLATEKNLQFLKTPRYSKKYLLLLEDDQYLRDTLHFYVSCLESGYLFGEWVVLLPSWSVLSVPTRFRVVVFEKTCLILLSTKTISSFPCPVRPHRARTAAREQA